MKILAIETSGPAGNVCLAEDEDARHACHLGDGMIHGRELVPAIDRIMRQAGWDPEDIELIAVSTGPGSFTGLRVGLAVAKTLALVGRTDLVGVPTLDVLARNAPVHAAHVCPVTDARRNEINSCLYRSYENGWQRLWDYRTHTAEYLCEQLPEGTCLLGDALAAYGTEFARRTDWVLCPEESWHAQALWVARLGLRLFREGRRDDPHELVPIYLRQPPIIEKLGPPPRVRLQTE
jgi:tRNA threonylcarbamoyladenosine biosynthesis protein TsaB